jgi:cytochrome c-type biogenesis protein CcmH/NrfF
LICIGFQSVWLQLCFAGISVQFKERKIILSLFSEDFHDFLWTRNSPGIRKWRNWLIWIYEMGFLFALATVVVPLVKRQKRKKENGTYTIFQVRWSHLVI